MNIPSGARDVTIMITTFLREHESAWIVTGELTPDIGHIFGYRLDAGDDGSTVVTSFSNWSAIDPVWEQADISPILSQSTLRATLGNLDRTRNPER